MKFVYWDTCCFIDYLKGTERGATLRGVVEQMEKGELTIVTSVITLTAVLKLDKGTPQEKNLIVSTFSENEGILLVDLTQHLAERSRELIWNLSYEKGHKMDCIHLATAVYFNEYRSLSEIHSFDEHFLKLNGSKYVPVPIVVPNYGASTYA